MFIFVIFGYNNNILRKMIRDNYDYIFIDEYQDSNENIVKDLISIADESKLTIALFGDSMQAIYKDGVGNVKALINDKTLFEVEKPDNYRCSYEVLMLINPLRLDEIEQEVAFKLLPDGDMETENDRHGEILVLYSICESKPNAFSSPEDKREYQAKVDELISASKGKYLKSILTLVNFVTIYVFLPTCFLRKVINTQ